MLSTAEVIEHIYLLDFGEKKYGLSKLIGKQELEILSKKVQCYTRTYNGNRLLPLIDVMSTLILDKSRIVHDILLMGNGKISFCGLNVFGLPLFRQTPKYNLYIHSCTLEEANTLIEECRKISKNKMFYDKTTNEYSVAHEEISIKISCNIFEDRQQILSSINGNAGRYGWDFKEGFFCDIIAGIIFFLGGFPLDTKLSDKELERYESYCLRPLIYSDNESITTFIRHLENRDVLNIIRDFQGNHICHNNFCQGIMFGKQNNGTDVFGPLTFYEHKPFPQVSIKKYFGKDYIPTKVGISDDKYVVINNVKKAFNLPQEILQLICHHWLESEIKDTCTKLLSN